MMIERESLHSDVIRKTNAQKASKPWQTRIRGPYLILSRKLTWNLRIDRGRWKTIFLYNRVVFRFHVKLQASNMLGSIQEVSAHAYVMLVINYIKQY